MLKILNRNKEICFPTMNGTIQIDIQQMIMPETSQLIITHLNSDILQELLQIDNKKFYFFVYQNITLKDEKTPVTPGSYQRH